jgi:hypothetical protein
MVIDPALAVTKNLCNEQGHLWTPKALVPRPESLISIPKAHFHVIKPRQPEVGGFN